MKTLEQIIHPIAAELARFEAFFEKTMKAETEPMNSIMQYVLDSKRQTDATHFGAAQRETFWRNQ